MSTGLCPMLDSRGSYVFLLAVEQRWRPTCKHFFRRRQTSIGVIAKSLSSFVGHTRRIFFCLFNPVSDPSLLLGHDFHRTEQCSFDILAVWLQRVLKKRKGGRVSIRNLTVYLHKRHQDPNLFLSDLQGHSVDLVLCTSNFDFRPRSWCTNPLGS